MLKNVAAAALVVMSLLGLPAHSDEIISEQYEYSGAAGLEDHLPEDTQRLLEESGIGLIADGSSEVDPAAAFSAITGLVAEQSKSPLVCCLTALGLSVLCALGGTVAGRSGSLVRSYETVSACAAVLTVCVPVAGFIDSAASAAASMCRFSSVLVPVLAGITYAGGHTASAAAYSGMTLAVIEVITLLCASVVVPILRILLGIAAAGSLDTAFDLSRITGGLEKSAKWLLGIMGVVMSGVMGVSSLSASAADTAAAKGARFVISGAVPVVGGAISDAIGTIANCVNVVRSSVGVFGIIAGLFILLPSIIMAVLWLGGLNFTSWAAQALGAERPAAVMRSLASVVSLTLGLIVFTAVVLTCSTALIISLRNG